VRQPGALITKNELIDAVWKLAAVSEVTLSTSISELRAALGDDARAPRFIETVHGRGFRFIAKLAAGHGRADGTPCFVGRIDEQATLRSWLRSARDGERVLGFVHGEAGIGKSAIVRSALGEVGSSPDVLLGIGTCVDRLCEGEPFGPVIQALGQLAGGAGRQRVAPALASRAPSWLLQLPVLTRHLTAERRDQLERETRGIHPARAVRELAEALEDLATHATVVLWLEDVHWADSGTWDVLDAVSRRPGNARILIVATHRPPAAVASGLELESRKPELVAAPHGRDLALEPLCEADLTAYLDARCPGAPRETATSLLAHTGGNALFAACVVDDLVASREASNGDAPWTPELEVPPELQLLIHRQFEALEAPQREFLEAASVAGTEFFSRSIAAALERPIEEVEASLESLAVEQQVLQRRAPEPWPNSTLCGRYAFGHALRRKALYDRLPVSRRARFHLAIAGDLVTGYGDQVAQVAAEVAGHHLAAGEAEEAIFYLCRASERALAQGAWDQAETQLAQAEGIFAQQPEESHRDHLEVDLQLTRASLGIVRRGLGDAGVRAAYERIGILGDRLGSHALVALSLDGISGHHVGRAEFDAVLEFAERLQTLGEQHDEPLYRMLSRSKSSCAYFYQGRFADCARDADECLRLSADTGSGRTEHQIDADPTTVAAVHSAVALQALGRTEEAALRSRESLAYARSLNDPFNECFALMYASYYRWFAGDWKAGLALAADCVAMASRHSYAMQWRIARIFQELGHAELGLPSLPAATPPEESEEESEGSQMGAPGLLWCVGREHLLRGRAEDALGSASLALALAGETAAPFQNAELLALQAGASLAAKRPVADADALYTQALDLSRAQQASWVELRILCDCAERLGLDDTRRARLASLGEQFRGFESPWTARAIAASGG
jgi:hypothetical protein